MTQQPIHFVPPQRPYYYYPKKKRKANFAYGCLLLLLLAGIALAVLSWWGNNQWQPQKISRTVYRLNNNGYILEQQPSLSVQQINDLLSYHNSPAEGKGQALYDYGVKYHIDPAFALAFFLHESSMGTKGVAVHTHSLGNIRVTAGYDDYQGYRVYPSWEEGFEDWYKLIRNEYINKGLHDVASIIPVYAPSEDNNDVDNYIASVKSAVYNWRCGFMDP